MYILKSFDIFWLFRFTILTLVVNSEVSLRVNFYRDVLAALKPELNKSELALILPSKISIYMAVAVQGQLI